jgi:hypothetical protein
MGRVTHIGDNAARSATSELDDVTAKIRFSGMAEVLEKASSEVRASH